MDIYGEIVLDHFRHPRKAKLLEGADWQATDSNPLCGDRVTVTLSTDQNGIITDFGFEGDGCAISVASTSLLGEKLPGRKLDELLKMPKEEVLDLLGIPISPGRIKCALLGYSCIKKALINAKRKE
jgi:nitrogen fixation NifU-like protein